METRYINQTVFLVFLLALLSFLPSASAVEIVLLDTDPSPVVAGDYADLTFRVSQELTEVTFEGLTIEIEESDDIRIIGQDNEYIGTLRPGETASRTIRVYFADDLPSGRLTIPVLLKGSQGARKAEMSVFIRDSEELPNIVVGQTDTTPEELLPDSEDNKLVVTLQNLGELEAEQVYVQMVPNDPTLITPSSAYSMSDSAASIAGGEDTEFEFTIDIDEKVRTSMEGELHIRYRSRRSLTDTYRVFEEKLPYVIELTEAPFIRVEGVKYDLPLMTGTTVNKVRVLLKNTGEKEAESVRIRFTPDISFPFLFDKTTHYITSELEPGEEINFEFELEVSQDGAARSYPIAIEIESLVGTTLYEQEDTITIDVAQGTNVSNRSIGAFVIVIIIVLAAAFGITGSVRRKRKAKKK